MPCLLFGDSGLLAGDDGMSILLAGMVVFISVVGPAGMAVAVGLRCPCPDLVQIRMPMPKSQRSAPRTPHPPPYHAVGGVQRGWERIWYCLHCRCCFSGGLPAPH